jgi:hypothetical protein
VFRTFDHYRRQDEAESLPHYRAMVAEDDAVWADLALYGSNAVTYRHLQPVQSAFFAWWRVGRSPDDAVYSKARQAYNEAQAMLLLAMRQEVGSND